MIAQNLLVCNICRKNIPLQIQGNRMDHFFHIQWFGQMCVHTTVQCVADIFCKSIGAFGSIKSFFKELLLSDL